MQIIRECPLCERQIKVTQKGKLLGHYRKQGDFGGFRCPGSFQTPNEVKKLMEDHNNG